jgi:hypothetical protein
LMVELAPMNPADNPPSLVSIGLIKFRSGLACA